MLITLVTLPAPLPPLPATFVPRYIRKWKCVDDAIPRAPRSYCVFPSSCPHDSWAWLQAGQQGLGVESLPFLYHPLPKHTQPPIPTFCLPVHGRAQPWLLRGPLWNALSKAWAGNPNSLLPRWQISGPQAHETSGTTNAGAQRTRGTPGAQPSNLCLNLVLR